MRAEKASMTVLPSQNLLTFLDDLPHGNSKGGICFLGNIMTLQKYRGMVWNGKFPTS